MSLGKFYPIHDMMLTPNYIVFAVSPLNVDLMGAALGNKPIAELLEYDKNAPIRILVFKKQGGGQPIEIQSLPSGLIFHNCNAFEDEKTGHLVFDTIVVDDDSAFALFKDWAKDTVPAGPMSWITRFQVDLKNQKVIARYKISDGIATDFPAVDSRRYGSSMSHYYALESHNLNDPLALNGLACWDLQTLRPRRVKAEAQQVWGEPLYVPHPSSDPQNHRAAWILHLGYDATRDQTFLDIRTPIDLELKTRIWFGRYIPIGFHGSFVQV